MTGSTASRSNSVLFAPVEAADVARELDGGDLHAEAEAEERDALLAGELRGADFALDAAVAKAAGDEDAGDVAQEFGRVAWSRSSSASTLHEIDAAIGGGAGVGERFVDRFVGVLELDVFADHGDLHALLRLHHAIHELAASRVMSAGGAVDAEEAAAPCRRASPAAA